MRIPRKAAVGKPVQNPPALRLPCSAAPLGGGGLLLGLRWARNRQAERRRRVPCRLSPPASGAGAPLPSAAASARSRRRRRVCGAPRKAPGGRREGSRASRRGAVEPETRSGVARFRRCGPDGEQSAAHGRPDATGRLPTRPVPAAAAPRAPLSRLTCTTPGPARSAGRRSGARCRGRARPGGRG